MIANGGPSDSFLTHGYRHKCACGSFWFDSDGGPCHEVCEVCEEIFDPSDGHDCKERETGE